MPITPVALPTFPIVLGPTPSGHRYQSIAQIAEGGMGAVYRGHRLEAGHPPVAIKLLSDRSEKMLARFRREIAAVEGLDHPNIVRTLDHGQDARFGPFIVMELLKGETLEQFLDRQPYGRLSVEQAAGIVLPICGALLYAHSLETPLMHRDVKPANIFLCENPEVPDEPIVKMMDFGLARNPHAEYGGTGARQKLTQVGTVVGTFQYSAPEQCDGRPRVESDVYALGIVFYLMIEGCLPFPEYLKEPLELIEWHKRGEPRGMKACDEPVLEKLISGMMAKRPGDRPSLFEVGGVVSGLTLRNASSPTLVGIPVIESPASEAMTAPMPLPVGAVVEAIPAAQAVTIRAASPVFRDPDAPQPVEDDNVYWSRALVRPALQRSVAGEIDTRVPRGLGKTFGWWSKIAALGRKVSRKVGR